MADRENVLVISPHPDDEAIGCGGTICHHVMRGDRVTVTFLTSGELGIKELAREEVWRVRETEARQSAAVLGVDEIDFLRLPDWYVGELVEEAATALRPILARESPTIIYLPHPEEWHPDHRASLLIVRTALEAFEAVPRVMAYEFWTPLQAYDHVEDITDTIARKLRAVRCYRSQLGEFQYDLAVRGLNQYRGVTAAKCRYAEVFGHVEIELSLPLEVTASC
jgi:N-acetylglucosamine malate deacetylase 1